MEQSAQVTTAAFAIITREEFAAWEADGLVDKDDMRKLVQLTRDMRLRSGQGYDDAQLRKVIRGGFKTTTQLVELIKNYYAAKKEMRNTLLNMKLEV